MLIKVLGWIHTYCWLLDFLPFIIHDAVNQLHQDLKLVTPVWLTSIIGHNKAYMSYGWYYRRINYNAYKARCSSCDISHKISLLQRSQNKAVDSGLVIHILFLILSSTPVRYYNMTGVKDLWPAALLLKIWLSMFIASIFSSSHSFLFNFFSAAMT